MALRRVLVTPTLPVHTECEYTLPRNTACQRSRGLSLASLRGGPGVISRQRKILAHNVKLR